MKLICPNCKAQYDSGRFCQECGTQLQEMVPELVCPSCGVKVKSGKFCPECGTKLTEQFLTSKPTKSEEPEVRKFNEKDQRFAKYYDRNGLPREIPQEERAVTLEELTPFVEQGVAEAKMLMGLILLNDASDESTEKCAELLKEAEQAGDEFAYYFMGALYYYGCPIAPQNHDETEKRYLELYQKYKNGDAAQLLAELYTYSAEKCDYKKAFEYASIAADDDEAMGYAILGALYFNGWGVEKNAELAFENYKMAAAFGDKDAMNQLGLILSGEDGIEENPEQAFYWFTEAANKGSDFGMNNVAYCYREGYGVEQDDEIAAEWYKKAAELGNADAMCNLGDYYQFIFHDFVKSKKWYLKAAKLGHSEAQEKLAAIEDADVPEEQKNLNMESEDKEEYELKDIRLETDGKNKLFIYCSCVAPTLTGFKGKDVTLDCHILVNGKEISKEGTLIDNGIARFKIKKFVVEMSANELDLPVRGDNLLIYHLEASYTPEDKPLSVPQVLATTGANTATVYYLYNIFSSNKMIIR